MEAKIIKGSVFGVPAGGTIVSLNNADISTVLSAASGLAKTLFSVAGKGLILATGLACLYLLLQSNKEYQGMRLDVMSKIDTRKRKFYGICISEILTIRVDKEELSIPTEYIKCIIERYDDVLVKLFDGAVYILDRETETSLSFLTTVGKQNIKIGHSSWYKADNSISGGTVQERDSLIVSLNNFLEEKDESIVSLLGKEKFEKFFYPSK